MRKGIPIQVMSPMSETSVWTFRCLYVDFYTDHSSMDQVFQFSNVSGPTVTSLILCLESVFAVVGGIIILNEQISMRETLRCIIMFAAILIAQIPAKGKVTNRNDEKAEAILDPEM